MSAPPSAQLRPMVSGSAWRTDCQNAPTVWPDSVRPDRSVMVPDTMSGVVTPVSAASRRAAQIAAFALSVSKIVSISSTSAPPSTRPAICWRYASAIWRNVIARYAGSSTFGDSDRVTLVGPIAPATQRGRPSAREAASTASRASRAPATLSSWTSDGSSRPYSRWATVVDEKVFVEMMSAPAAR